MRAAQLERLKRENTELKKRVAAHDQKLAEAAEFKTLAISWLTAQYDWASAPISRRRCLSSRCGKIAPNLAANTARCASNPLVSE
ncbi:hypothetical protein [Streptomyces sp. SD15]